MNTYIYNPSKCPQFFGADVVLQPNNYCVVPNKLAESLKESNVPVHFEGSPEFQSLWVENRPDKTPDQMV
jgi:hypothetical protein